MSFRNDLYEICLASESDGEQINKIFDSGSFDGNISVKFARKPNPYISMQNDGEKAVVCLLKEKAQGLAVGVGACIIRKAFIGEEIKTVGYLTGLKILPEYQKKIHCISQCYQFLHEQTKNCVDLYYTTILKENVAAQKLLEKKRKNMPEYIYKGDYTVYCMKAGGRKSGLKIERGITAELKEYLLKKLAEQNLTSAELALFGINNDDFFACKNQEGEIVAATAVWNQQSYKQYIVTAYGGIYKWLSKLPVKFLGYPPFPKLNTSANYASLSFLYYSDNSIAKPFIKNVVALSAQYDFLMLGLHEKDELNEVCQGIKHVKYQSKLYAVDFDETLEFDNKNIYLDVGLL